MAFCRACGKDIPDDAVICVGCGRATGVPMPASVAPAGIVAAVDAVPSAAGAAPADNPMVGLHIAAYLTAVLFPLVGLICGIIIVARGKTSGVPAIVISVVMMFAWLSVASR